MHKEVGRIPRRDASMIPSMGYVYASAATQATHDEAYLDETSVVSESRETFQTGEICFNTAIVPIVTFSHTKFSRLIEHRQCSAIIVVLSSSTYISTYLIALT